MNVPLNSPLALSKGPLKRPVMTGGIALTEEPLLQEDSSIERQKARAIFFIMYIILWWYLIVIQRIYHIFNHEQAHCD